LQYRFLGDKERDNLVKGGKVSKRKGKHHGVCSTRTTSHKNE